MNDRVIIEKADGSQSSVIEADFRTHYPDVKYTVIGPETDGAFIADVPRPVRRAGARRKTTKAATPAKKPSAPAPTTTEAEA